MLWRQPMPMRGYSSSGSSSTCEKGEGRCNFVIYLEGAAPVVHGLDNGGGVQELCTH